MSSQAPDASVELTRDECLRLLRVITGRRLVAPALTSGTAS